MGEPVHVAFVDDEEDLHSLFSIYFKKEVNKGRLKLHNFLNGKECLNFLNGQNGDDGRVKLILTDVQMPEMDGFTLLENVKQQYPDVKVYIATAYDSPEYRDRAKNLGADMYLEKPLIFDEVKALVLEFANGCSGSSED